jgi:uncharacterized membrane protein YebE (DUF533 family)
MVRAMKRYVPWRQRPSKGGEHAYQVAALRLQLLVAMAASDGKVQTIEVDRVAQTIDDAALDEENTHRLEQLLRMLLNAPPSLEQLVERITEQAPKRQVAETLVRELVHVAKADDHLDDSEEALLRLVCGALRLEPSTLSGGRGPSLDARERAQLDALLAAVASE